jgi:hypothetical protein
MLLALVPPDAVVRGPNLPPPTDGLYALAPLVVLLLVLSVLYWVRLRRVRKSARRRAGMLPGFALSVALGNALVELGAMLEPSRPVAMAMQRADGHRDDEGVGDGRTADQAQAISPVSQALALRGRRLELPQPWQPVSPSLDHHR